jgi:ribosomal protein S18 acetylase RimI-like enzyme
MAELTCVDWRDVPEPIVAPLYRAEAERWASTLEWDAASGLREVERGRQLRTVSGFVALDERREVAGWTFYLVHEGVLQIGGFVSSSEACTTALLAAVLRDPEAAGADVVTLFVFSDAPGLVQAARDHRLAVSRYWYLAREVDPGRRVASHDARKWRVDDAPATVDLLMRAYGASDGSRPFAPRGQRPDWELYVKQIIEARGCGTIMPEASFCVPAGPGRLAAVALVSRIGPHTGHLVQLAVDPQFQRRGIGSSLVESACYAVALAGCRKMTLLVAGQDRRARALYDGAGFESVASFVAAGAMGAALQPRRSTSVAPGASVATFR